MRYNAFAVDEMKCRFYKIFEHQYRGKIGTVEYWRQARPVIEKNMREWKASEKTPQQFLIERGLWNLLMKLVPKRKK